MKKNKYIIYLRVSTDMQDVAMQTNDILEFIKRLEDGKEFEYIVYIDHDTTAGLPLRKRLQLCGLLKDLKKGDKLCIYKLDRLSRDIIEMVSLHRQIKSIGCDILSPHDSYCNDEFIVSIMGSVAQQERTTLKTRVRSGMKNLRDKNLRSNYQIPYGYRLDTVNLVMKGKGENAKLKPGLLIEDKEEQRVLQFMQDLQEQGLSYEYIARNLTKMGCVNRKGNPFQKNTIYRILKRIDLAKPQGQLQIEQDDRSFLKCK